MKRCIKCKMEKPLTEFRAHPSTKDKHQSSCTKCAREYHAARYELMPEYRQAVAKRGTAQRDVTNTIVNRYKLFCGCINCGENRHHAVLDLHHIHPRFKSFSIGSGRGKLSNDLIIEMKKCAVLCANCHRLLHAKLWLLTEDQIAACLQKHGEHFPQEINDGVVSVVNR